MESQRKAWMNSQSLQKKLWLKINKKSFFLKKNKLELIKKTFCFKNYNTL